MDTYDVIMIGTGAGGGILAPSLPVVARFAALGPTFRPGYWGPAAANELVADHGNWHEPWTTP